MRAGDAVTFVNDDDDAHTATADDGSWDSEGLNQGQKWATPSPRAGKVTYHCTVHPFMKGTLVVQGAKTMKRRDFVGHVAWTGAGILYVLGAEGIMRATAEAAPGTFSFVQISDSHIGYTGPANDDVRATLQKAVADINAMPNQPTFVIHTGDVTHLSKARSSTTRARS